MTKKHYTLIAAAIAETVDAYAEIDTAGTMSRMAIRDTALSIADVLEVLDTRFDRDRFLVACGVR